MQENLKERNENIRMLFEYAPYAANQRRSATGRKSLFSRWHFC